MKTTAIITAGGTSSRFGTGNKLLEKIYGKEVIKYTIEAFEKADVDEIIISANKSIIPELSSMFNHKITEGGSTGQASVYNGLKAIEKSDFVLIHDGARPVITPEIINRTIDLVKGKNAVSVVTKTIDTIKEVQDGKIIKTIDRSKLYNTQTPQAFRYDIIMSAHEKLQEQNFTDDAGMLEALGYDVYIVDGSYKNIKITTQSDIEIAKIFLK